MSIKSALLFFQIDYFVLRFKPNKEVQRLSFKSACAASYEVWKSVIQVQRSKVQRCKTIKGIQT